MARASLICCSVTTAGSLLPDKPMLMSTNNRTQGRLSTINWRYLTRLLGLMRLLRHARAGITRNSEQHAWLKARRRSATSGALYLTVDLKQTCHHLRECGRRTTAHHLHNYNNCVCSDLRDSCVCACCGSHIWHSAKHSAWTEHNRASKYLWHGSFTILIPGKSL
jgi:hypothetical protein